MEKSRFGIQVLANRKMKLGSTKIAVQRTGRESGHATLEKGEVKRKGPKQTPKHQVERCFSPKTRLGEGLTNIRML